jgi:PIN domain nuclease of toxin-antitoxin system
MRFLLDTHILLWWIDDDKRLSGQARQIIQDQCNEIYVSDISFWEIQIKVMNGKLNVDLETVIQQLPVNNFLPLNLNSRHIMALAKIPDHHQDPFDRMLIAQAITEPLHLITHDAIVAKYSENIILV